MGFGDWMDRLLRAVRRESDSATGLSSRDRGTNEDTVLVAPSDPARSPHRARRVQQAHPAQPAVEPADRGLTPEVLTPEVLTPGVEVAPAPAATALPAPETQLHVPPAPPVIHESEAAPNLPEAETEVGRLPPAREIRDEPSAAFPRPIAPPSIRPVPHRARSGPAQDDHGIAGVLVGLRGPLHRHAIVVPRGIATLGSTLDCEIQLDEPGLAGRHARFETGGGETSLVPCESHCVVSLNGHGVMDRQVLCDNDIVCFGDSSASLFRYRTIEGLEATK